LKSLTLLSLLIASSAHAQDTPTPAPAPASALAPTMSADLRSEYLAGEQVLVQIQARNEGSAPVTIPDLSVRHDLVRFELKLPGGATDNRRTLTEAPSDRTWQIPPRGAREVLLELPASSTLRPGEYQLAIHVALSEGDERTLAPATIRLASPTPVEADLAAGSMHSERGSDLIPWVHKARDGYDLYLYRSSSSEPARARSEDFLARLPAQVDPVLTAARTTEASGRYVVWLHEDRTISYGELQGHQLRNGIQTVSAPWPKVALAARGVTSPEGHLYQPLWIPAPSGDAGELRMLTTTSRGVAYRRIARFQARPEVIETTIDDGGSMHLVTVSGGAVDIYTVRAGTDPDRAAEENLPLRGRRLLAAVPEQPVRAARFGILKAAEGYPGGLALMLLTQTGPEQLTPSWLSLTGQTVRTGAPLVLPEGAQLLDLSPSAAGDVGALMRLASGQLRYVEGDRYQRLTRISGEAALDRTDAGVPYLRSLAAPLATTMLLPETPLP
jgi:hypothetical protein